MHEPEEVEGADSNLEFAPLVQLKRVENQSGESDEVLIWKYRFSCSDSLLYGAPFHFLVAGVLCTYLRRTRMSGRSGEEEISRHSFSVRSLRRSFNICFLIQFLQHKSAKSVRMVLREERTFKVRLNAVSAQTFFHSLL